MRKCSAQDVSSGPSAVGDEVLQVGKIAVDHVLGRHRTGCGSWRYKPVALIVNEEERPVFSVVNLWDIDRSAKGRAELVLVIRRHRLWRC